MNLLIKATVITDSAKGLLDADYLLCIALAVFQTYIERTTAEEFQKQWGTRGVTALSKYTTHRMRTMNEV